MDEARATGVEPYVRGAPWPAADGVPYPRARPHDLRLPGDTRLMANQPAGVRLELVGDAPAIDIRYRTTTDDAGLRGPEFGRHFTSWTAGGRLDAQPAVLGPGTVRLATAGPGGRTVVHLPEAMRPAVSAIDGVDGAIEPAPHQRRWIAYGDSITEGWAATSPGLSWPALAAREHGLDVVNLGYAGSARGELASAEHIADQPAEVISLMFGTNCWSVLPCSEDLLRTITEAFIRIVRAGHPNVPIVVVSPILRPDAEATPNRLGATLADLRRSVEAGAVVARDRLVTVLAGAELLSPELLVDGIHPGDDGHRVLAEEIGGAVARAVDGAA